MHLVSCLCINFDIAKHTRFHSMSFGLFACFSFFVVINLF